MAQIASWTHRRGGTARKAKAVCTFRAMRRTKGAREADAWKLFCEVRLAPTLCPETSLEETYHPVWPPVARSLTGKPPTLIRGVLPNPVLQPCCNRSSTEPNQAGFDYEPEGPKPLR
jgi:hypothetical protein